MIFVVAPDSFKGSLTSKNVCDVVEPVSYTHLGQRQKALSFEKQNREDWLMSA